ncbi:MAG: hypothetical protein ACE15E_17265 [Acidobacteriota bacterium]
MSIKKSESSQSCEICGCPEALQFADQWICEDCYQGRSSCCPEFGKDDLWTFEEDEMQAAEEEKVLQTK